MLDSREGLLQGSDSGAAVVPGDLEANLLWSAIQWKDDLEMPPKRQLPDTALEGFGHWILMGVPDPRVSEAVTIPSEIDVGAGRQFWSFQKPLESELPPVQDRAWPKADVDHFVLSKIEESGLAPGQEASLDTLLRRLYIDLIGLVPTPGEVKAYAIAWKGDPQVAYEAKVSELLDSTHFGERWGRHWLNVARYAESSGKETNVTHPHAWRYRDYVINAFNKDKPYDRFIQEQIAGDLLPVTSDVDWQENLIATGFLTLGPKGLSERNARQFAMDLADEQIDATTQAVLGLTVSCARCHDHKSDPIPTTDYYALSGIFQSSKTHFGTVGFAQNRRASNLLELPIWDATPIMSYSSREMTQLKDRLAAGESELEELGKEERRQRVQMRLNPDKAPSTPQNNVRKALRLRSSTAILQGKLDNVDDEGAAKSLAMGVQDRPVPTDDVVLIRGEIQKPAQKVPRGFLQVLPHTATAELPSSHGSGRLEFAQWLTSPENPLTARVIVNRVWQQLFGRGLVTSPNDFRATGQRPSHPELLDHLAVKFMENGWSMEGLIRDLVHTRTYQLSATIDPLAYAKDPENVLLWRRTPRRLDAEVLRDAMLVVSGRLVRERPLGSSVAALGDVAFGRRASSETVNQSVDYRSVYLPIIRDAVPEALALFDAADTNIVTGTRESTNVPGQALYMMNNPFVIEQSRAFARRLLKEEGSPRDRLTRAYTIAFGRPISHRELADAGQCFRQFVSQSMEESDRSRGEVTILALSNLCQSLLASAEFRYFN